MASKSTGLKRLTVVGIAAGLGFAGAFAATYALTGGEGNASQGAGDPTATSTPLASATATMTPTATQPPPTATPTPTMTPTPTPAIGWEAFAAELQAAADNYWVTGRYAAAITDLQTGYTALVNGDQHQLTGCIVNLFILVAALQDVEAGKYPAAAVDELIDATIWSSNASTAYELYRIVGDGDPAKGVDRVQSIFDSLGMTETQIDHPPAFSGDGTLAEIDSGGVSAQAVPDDTNNWTTARDVNVALTALYNGELLSPEGTEDFLQRLTNVKAGLNYLVAYVPGPAEVSHKNGFFPNNDSTWVDNDAGIVRVERDGVRYAYAVSFFSDSVPEKYADIPLGQEISRIAYEYFARVYGE
jgi:beta-lactamase class A